MAAHKNVELPSPLRHYFKHKQMSNYLKPDPLPSRYSPPSGPALLGAPPFDVKPEKVCNDDECNMYNYQQPVPLLSRYLDLLLRVSWVYHLLM